MKKKSKDQGHLIVANEDGAQRTGSGDDMDGIHCRFTLWGYSRSWRAPCSSKRMGGIKERREGSLDEGDMRVVVSPKEEREGVRYGDEGEDREPTGCREKGKRTVHEFEGCGIMPWLYENRVLVDPDTDGVCRACDTSDRHA